MALHLAFNHPPLQLIRTIINIKAFTAINNIVNPLKVSNIPSMFRLLGKKSYHPPSNSNSHHSIPGSSIGSDAIVYISPKLGRPHRQIVTFIDTASCFVMAQPIKYRSKIAKLIPVTNNSMRHTHGRHKSRFQCT